MHSFIERKLESLTKKYRQTPGLQFKPIDKNQPHPENQKFINCDIPRIPVERNCSFLGAPVSLHVLDQLGITLLSHEINSRCSIDMKSDPSWEK